MWEQHQLWCPNINAQVSTEISVDFWQPAGTSNCSLLMPWSHQRERLTEHLCRPLSNDHNHKSKLNLVPWRMAKSFIKSEHKPSQHWGLFLAWWPTFHTTYRMTVQGKRANYWEVARPSCPLIVCLYLLFFPPRGTECMTDSTNLCLEQAK